MNDFKWISFVVAGLIGIVYGIKVWDDLSRPECDSQGNCKPPRTKGTLLRNAIYSAFGSAIVCLLVCEGLIYYAELPFNLALLVGAICGFTGAETFKDMILRFVENKLNTRRSDEKD